PSNPGSAGEELDGVDDDVAVGALGADLDGAFSPEAVGAEGVEGDVRGGAALVEGEGGGAAVVVDGDGDVGGAVVVGRVRDADLVAAGFEGGAEGGGLGALGLVGVV